MKIYVGRWDLLPANWEGYNGLSEKVEPEISKEISREIDMCEDDYFIAVYTPEEFEETFNADINNAFRTDTYWIKIF